LGGGHNFFSEWFAKTLEFLPLSLFVLIFEFVTVKKFLGVIIKNNKVFIGQMRHAF